MRTRLPLAIGAAVLAAAISSVAAAAWTPPVTISALSANPLAPVGSTSGMSAAMGTDGAVTAVWAQAGPGEATDSAYSARMVDGNWSAPTAISSAGEGVMRPAVAVGGADNPFTTWLRGVTFGSRSVQGARYSAGRWVGEAVLAPVADNGSNVFVAADGPDSAMAVWGHTENATSTVRSARFSDGAWGTGTDIPGTTSSWPVRLVAGAPGQVTAVWSNGALMAETATATNGVWGAKTTHSMSAGTPSLALNSAGAGVLVTVDGTIPNRVRAVRRTSSGWGSDELVSPASQGSTGAVAAVDGAGVITIAWVHNLPDNTQVVQAVRSTASGWTAPVDLSGAEPATVAMRVVIAAGVNGQVAVMWTGREGALDVVRAASYGSSWSPAAVISQAQAGQGPDTLTPFQLSVDSLGRASAAWLWNLGGGTDVVDAARLQGVPNAPAGATARAGDASAVVAWTAPADNGGSAITAYRVTSVPGGHTCTATTVTTCTVSGLANGTDYAFTVAAANAIGTGPESSATAKVMPVAPARVVGSLKATVKVKKRVITTTGSVAKGVTKVAQRLTAPRKKARTASCRILAAPRTGADRAYRCTIRVPAAKWKLVTEARDQLGVVARSTRSTRVR